MAWIYTPAMQTKDKKHYLTGFQQRFWKKKKKNGQKNKLIQLTITELTACF